MSRIRAWWHIGDEMAKETRDTGALQRSKAQAPAFEEFYDEHADSVLAFFARRTFDVEAARDLMAETFAQAFQHRRRFRGDSDEAAAGWLYAIARDTSSATTCATASRGARRSRDSGSGCP